MENFRECRRIARTKKIVRRSAEMLAMSPERAPNALAIVSIKYELRVIKIQ